MQLCMLVAASVSPIAVGPVISVVGADNVILVVVAVSVVNFAYIFLFLRGDDRQSGDRERVASDGQTSNQGKCLTNNEDDPCSLMGSVNRYGPMKYGCGHCRCEPAIL